MKPKPYTPFAGRTYDVHVDANNLDNRSPLLIGADFLKKNRCIIDHELGLLVYKDDPTTVHHLKMGGALGQTILMPITRDQCDMYYYRTKIDQSHDEAFQSTVKSMVKRSSQE